jgi:DNA-binding MarR family transcriptional regulator
VVTTVRTGESFLALANRALGHHGLSAAARQVLAVLDGAGGALPAGVVAERLVVTTGTITSVVDTLERRGLVERRADPADRRRVLVAITPDGSALVDRFLPEMAALQTAVAHGIPEAQRETVVQALLALTTAIAKIDPADALSRTRPRAKTQPSRPRHANQ